MKTLATREPTHPSQHQLAPKQPYELRGHPSIPLRSIDVADFQQVGGHSGSFQQVDSGRFLLKTTCQEEYLFYEKAFRGQLGICEFMPKYYGALENQALRTQQIKIENLAANMTAPNIIDIKIGCRTSSYSQLRKQGMSRARAAGKTLYMRFSDRISSTGELGFRVVSLSGGSKTKAQFGLMEPKGIIEDFRPKNQATAAAIMHEVDRLQKFVQSDEFNKYSIIGASALLLYDESGDVPLVKVKLIDFAHSSVVDGTQDKNSKYTERFRYGMHRLHAVLNAGLAESKISKPAAA